MTMTAATDGLLVGLDPEQRAAVTSEASPLAILAGAGSGKTRVLTRRIAWRVQTGVAEARNVLALTFTRKAAGELNDRLRRLGGHTPVVAGTFHAIALAQLRRRASDADRPMPALLERKARLLVPIIGGDRKKAPLIAAEVAGEIEWAKARLLTPDKYVATVLRTQRATPHPVDQIADWYRAYERDKKRKRLVDFDDLIWWCSNALETDQEFAAAQRFRFRHLYVDEFQDVTPAQLRLVRGWLGDRRDLTVVGDPDQAIYGFAGADAGLLLRFGTEFPGGETVSLITNYRSTPQVVGAARSILPNPLAGTRLEVRTPLADGPKATVHTFDDDAAEAAGAAKLAVAANRSGVAWSQIAILYRTNAQSALFEEALRHAAVPVRMRGDARFLDRAEIKTAVTELRASARTAPGRAFAEHLVDIAEDAATIEADDRRTNLESLVRLGREYLSADGGTGSVDGFLSWLNTALRGGDMDSSGNAVELLTFHRAKGLEFDTVIVSGLERGQVPISHAKEPAALAEERRLLYVALSRAHRRLHCTWAKERSFGLRTSNRDPSPYLASIEAAIDGSDPIATTPVGRDAVTSLRQSVRGGRGGKGKATLSDDDQPLFDALKDWRRDQAKTANVPAYVIFNDATLAEIATARPTSRDQLLGISGIGPVKVDRWADALLAVVHQH
jgi:DNA helicase-2/ATP-dependent DNA helicase PcrA